MMLSQPKLNAISIYQNALKMLFFNENHKLKILVEFSTLVEYSTRSQKKSKYTFDQFHFLIRVRLNKIDENIDASDPPSKTFKMEGGFGALK